MPSGKTSGTRNLRDRETSGTDAGYSVAEELPIFLVIFALPAAAAAFVWWKFS